MEPGDIVEFTHFHRYSDTRGRYRTRPKLERGEVVKVYSTKVAIKNPCPPFDFGNPEILYRIIDGVRKVENA